MFVTLYSEQGFVEVVSWLDEVRPLLYSTPLLSVLSRTHLLVNNLPAVATKPWNTQQVCAGNIYCATVLQTVLVHPADNLFKKKRKISEPFYMDPKKDVLQKLFVLFAAI